MAAIRLWKIILIILKPDNEMVLGSHMLEICESYCQTVNLPAKFIRLVLVEKQIRFGLYLMSAGGPALNASIVDMGNRFRLLVNEVKQ